MKLVKNALSFARAVPKSVWIGAIIIPGGFIAIGTYLIFKTASSNKEQKDDRSEDNQRLDSSVRNKTDDVRS